MIDYIQIADTATFGSDPEPLHGLSKFNYIFGSNGSGKTTITRVIADEASFPTCRLTWKKRHEVADYGLQQRLHLTEL